jgi:hypothetical protein
MHAGILYVCVTCGNLIVHEIDNSTRETITRFQPGLNDSLQTDTDIYVDENGKLFILINSMIYVYARK